jgi:hypothetical protein
MEASYRISSSVNGTRILRGARCYGGKGRFTAEDFEYDKKRNRYICPTKKRWNIKGM